MSSESMPFRLVGACVLAFAFAAVVPKVAHSKPDVYFAGFAYLGNAADAQERYPHTHHLAPIGGETSEVEVALRKTVGAISPEHYTLIEDQLADIKSGESLTVAFALERETVDIERVCGNHKIVIDLTIQAMVFDFETMAVVGSYPLTLQYIDLLENQPSEREVTQILKELYTGERELDIFGEFASTLENARIRKRYGNTIKVKSVTLGDKVATHLPDKYTNNHDSLRTFIAQSMSSALASKHGISVLPYTKGYTVGNRMAARFANGDIYSFKIPDPDYAIDLRLRGFKKVNFDQSSSGKSVVYGSFINFRATEPLSGKVFIDQRFKRGATKVIPKCQLQANDWPAYQESLVGLFDELAEQFSARDRRWLQSHAGGGVEISELKAMNKVIERCK